VKFHLGFIAKIQPHSRASAPLLGTTAQQAAWGPITAAVMFLIILAGLIVYGSGVHL
jgi:hypothetical protein